MPNIPKWQLLFNKDEAQLLCDKYVRGHSVPKLAKLHNCSNHIIYKMLFDNDIKIDKNKALTGNAFWKHMTKEKRQVFLKDKYLNEKLSTKDIGKICEVSAQTIANQLYNFGIKVRSSGRKDIAKKVSDKTYKRQNWTPTKEQEQIIYGSLIGNGCIPKSIFCNAHFEENHCLKQEEYIRYKAKMLEDITSSCKYRLTHHTSFGHYLGKKKVALRTRSFSYFTKLRKLFYPNDKKIITQEILDKVESLGLAIWYMDRGSSNYNNKHKSRQIRICTHNFTIKENKLIQQWFKDKWEINARTVPTQSGSGVVQYFSPNESLKLIDLTCSYIQEISCMRYKIGTFHTQISHM